MRLRPCSASLCSLTDRAANDNAPCDPLDYEDFDPSLLPADAFYDAETRLDLVELIELLDR